MALPPEVNTGRLMAGAGAAPMLQAAAGWEALAVLLEAQADELAASLANLSSVWTGGASERAVAATMPMVVWLRTTSAQAMKRALQAANQANSYTLAMATTPPIPEIEQNHITHAVLEATNFLGVNTVPIGVNEFDYFVRMWQQAAGAMSVYQAETQMNMLFEPIPPMTPIVIPGVGEATGAAATAQASARAPMGALRNGMVSMVSSTAKMESVGLNAGRAMAQGNMAGQRAQGAVQKGEQAAQSQPQDQLMQQGVQMGVQMAGQVGSMVSQVPQQFGQMVQTPMQMLTQPLQQVSSIFGQLGGNLSGDKAQIGLIGATPFSNHPLAGGSGASSGAGLVRAASLPGAGGTGARTPLMANLIGDKVEAAPVAVGAGAAAGAAVGGLAPVGGAGGGMGPMGMAGQNSKSGGSKPGLTAPAPLAHDLDEDEGDDW
ncbi:PPE family protein [Mycobacterium sp. GA-2829]|uniref:PPE family protein n=1 Tax=Mycobacterium sp. GA-2829 TaxID=1772283 RepID=UPI0026F41D3D|nr:PPE family protein [Mycobacterium sp. GA-2829]